MLGKSKPDWALSCFDAIYSTYDVPFIDQLLFFFRINLNKSCIDSSTGCPKWIAFDGGYFLVASCSHANVSAWLSGKIHFHSQPHDRPPPQWPCCRELHWFTEEANPFNTTPLFSLLSEASPEIDVCVEWRPVAPSLTRPDQVLYVWI